MASTQRFRILHLSDTHFFGDDRRHYDVVDTEANLRAVLDRVQHVEALDLVAVTGDLSEDGSEESYRRLQAMVEGFAAQHGARTAYVMGNHDRRPAFRAVLGDGLDPHASGEPEAPVLSTTTLGGLRVVVLDTSVPRAGYGQLGREQLDALTAVLAEPAPAGTLVLLHHPPVAAQTDLLNALALQNPGELAEIVRGSDVRAVLAGHYHHPLIAQWAGVPVIVSAAVTNLAEAFGDPAEERAAHGAGGTVIDLGPGAGLRALPFHAPLADSGPVFAFGAETVARIVQAAGPDGPER